jgi:hypothetical protein
MSFRKQRKKHIPALPIIVSMSPPGYPQNGCIPAWPASVSGGSL